MPKPQNLLICQCLGHAVSGVREIFDSSTNNPFGVLCEPLDYDEVACVCSKLKLGVTGLCIDYEHIHLAGPPVWRLLFELYQNFYANGSGCESLKTGVILPLFKGKGTEANNKDNYMGTTLFLTVKFMRWCFSTDLKTMLNKTDCFQICLQICVLRHRSPF